MSLEVKQLTKSYKGQKAVDDISFTARSGQVLGFLGPNGAGKSTTMKVASGYILPDKGDVLINGLSVLEKPKEVSRIMGYLPEHNPLYQDMYVKEFLGFVAHLYQLKGSALNKRLEDIIDQCGLGSEQKKKIGQLSKGYKQRVGLAKALVHRPKVIILDEPTTGLDPNQLVEIRKLIKEIGRDNTLIMSTHIMQEVEAICDKVVIIHQGKIVAQDLLKNLKIQGQAGLILETEEPLEKGWFETIESIDQIHILKNNRFEFLTSRVDLTRTEVLRVVMDKNLSLLGLSQQEKNLESIFHQLTRS